jgi:hypothetical protein
VRSAVLVLALAAGCRWNFDEIGVDGATGSDVPAGHDEDGDGVPDLDDSCPHVAGAQTDQDGDGVGDVCDPRPGQAGDQLVAFDPLITGAAFTVISATWQETGDALRCDANGEFGQLIRPLAFDHGVVELGVDIVARNEAVTQHQVSVAALDDEQAPYYYVEVYEPDAGTSYAAASAFDGTAYTPLAMQALDSGVHTGRLRLQLSVTPPAPSLTVRAMWGAESYSASVAVPDFAGYSKLSVGTQGLLIDLAYVAVIASP